MRKIKININYIILALLLIMDAFDGRFSSVHEWFYHTLIILPGIIIGIAFHEFAHGLVSHILGDPTPKSQGRLTLNPVAHLEPVGFIALITVGFGWGKPVEIDTRYYKHKRRDEFFVSIAGVFTNLLLAILFALIVKIIMFFDPIFFIDNFGSVVLDILKSAILINLVLMIFNLIPVPPLDGFGVITSIFDLKKYSWYDKVYSMGMWILMILIIFDFTEIIINPALAFCYSLVVSII